MLLALWIINREGECKMYNKYGNDTYVKGRVSHAGREHRDLELDVWYKVYANTSVGSFTIVGDID